MPISSSAAAQHYRERENQAREALGWFGGLQQRVQQLGSRCESEHQLACVDLAAAYQQSIDPNALARVEALTGYLGFKRFDPTKALEHERKMLENTVIRIEQDPRFIQREELAGPDGTLRAKIAEAQEMMEPFDAACSRFESQEGFTDLLQVGYDTPDFSVSFFKADYWRFWAAGDRICKALGLDDFGDDVLPAYQKEASQRDFWRDEIAKHDAALREVHGLVQQHDEAKARIPNLAAMYLERCQEQLGNHLEQADIGLLEEWRSKIAPDDRAIEMALRRVSGLRAKFNMLRSLHDAAVVDVMNELQGRAGKYSRKVTKFSRPKYYGVSVSERELDQKFDAKLPKLRERYSKLDRIVDRIDRYGDYQRFSLSNDQSLWWYEFTRTRPPRELTRLRSYYDRHPELVPAHDDLFADDHRRAVAVATVDTARARPDDGYLS